MHNGTNFLFSCCTGNTIKYVHAENKIDLSFEIICNRKDINILLDNMDKITVLLQLSYFIN